MRDFYISVDIETHGPIPGEYSIIAIGAVAVSDPSKSFSAFLRPISDSWDTLAAAVSGIQQDWLMQHGEEAAVAIARFVEWVVTVTPTCARPVFIGFNASFDWMFIYWYCQYFLQTNPFGYSALDIKAYAMGALRIRSWKQTSMQYLPKEIVHKRRLTHDALDDAKKQANIFSALYGLCVNERKCL